MRHTRSVLGGVFARNGKVWRNDRPGLDVTVDERQLAFVEAVTEGAPGASQKRLDGSLTQW